MYLTAQRVTSQSGKVGINAFYHTHPKDNQPVLKSEVDLIAVAETNTGSLVKEECELSPGENRVRSFLDIVAHDDIGLDAVKSALEDFKIKIVTDRLTSYAIGTNIAIRFSVEYGLFEMAEIEYSDLCLKALYLFESVKI